MPATVDYYFTSASPFTYLGHQALMDVAAKHGASIVFKPVNLMGLWEVSGAVPPGQRPAVRQRYRFVELQRVAERRGLPINIRPEFFPVDPQLADLSVVALVAAEKNPSSFMEKLFSGVWVENGNIADEDAVRSYLDDCGYDANAIIASAKSDAINAVRTNNTKDAIAADAVGVPAYVLNGEPFWGQDRIAYLDEALQSGREAFQAP